MALDFDALFPECVSSPCKKKSSGEKLSASIEVISFRTLLGQFLKPSHFIHLTNIDSNTCFVVDTIQSAFY